MTSKSKKEYDQVVLITGASSGIGEQLAYKAAQKGYRLVLTARNLEKLDRIANRCRRISQKSVSIYPMDISRPKEIEQTIPDILQETGRIDVLINNAGFGLTDYFLQADLQKAEQMFRVNVLGILYLTQLIAIQMAEQGSGHLFMVASMAGKIATPKSSLYAATKAAVLAFSNALRMEMKPLGIFVTTVNPGPADTPFFDSFDPDGTYLEKVGKTVLSPQEIAEKVIRNIGKPKREINLPIIMEIGSRLYHLFPTLGDFLIIHLFDHK